MQRPILAQVHQNRQMMAILQATGHRAIEVEFESSATSRLNNAFFAAIADYAALWSTERLNDNEKISPHTTAASIQQLLKFVT